MCKCFNGNKNNFIVIHCHCHMMKGYKCLNISHLYVIKSIHNVIKGRPTLS